MKGVLIILLMLTSASAKPYIKPPSKPLCIIEPARLKPLPRCKSEIKFRADRPVDKCWQRQSAFISNVTK